MIAHTRLRILALCLILSACGPAATQSPASPTPADVPSAAAPLTPAPIEASSETILTPTTLPEIEARPILADTLPDLTLDVELFYSERWMRVRQTLQIENTSPDTWGEIVFNIPINAYEDLFWLDSVLVTQGANASSDYPGFSTFDTILRIPLIQPANPGDTITIELGYRVIIPPVASTDWPPIGTTGWTFDVIQAGEWYPALVPYVDGQGWYTWNYWPVGDPTVYPLVNTHLNVTADPGIMVASGGLIGQEGATWRFEVDAGRGVAFLASDHFTMREREVDGLPVRSYFRPEHAAAGETALDIAVQSLALYSELFGPYPYKDLAVVENGFFGGMEYSALASISDYVYWTYQGEPPSILHALVSHEVAHQWWYGAVGNDQANEPWLDEALAFYGEYLYFERYLPEFADWWWVKRVDQFHPTGAVNATIYDYDLSSDFILIMYGQSARFMRDLRALMGDEQFFAFLQDYYATYSGQIATGDDFFGLLSTYVDETDLTRLREQYFLVEDDIEESTTP